MHERYVVEEAVEGNEFEESDAAQDCVDGFEMEVAG